MKTILPFFLLFALLPVLSSHAASWQENRLTPLEKITVGPWDSFEATITKNGQQLFFTRNINQIPNIFQQKISENASQYLIGKEGDAKDPSLSPSGSHLLFTYYKNDAQGDICLLALETNITNCFTNDKTLDQAPFWIDENSIGYLQREIDSLEQSLVQYNLKNKKATTIHKGRISAPTASSNGKYLVFNERETSGQRSIIFFNLSNNTKSKLAELDIPGISGFMAFSLDNKYIYFNHYLSDTNQDQTINANDHSVVFRLSLNNWLNSKSKIFPQQLTSVEHNCKFPALSQTHVYLTCAFEGSLDIYRLPLEGSIKTTWDEKQLWQAHKSARSYEDRILILNTIRYKYPDKHIELIERLINNHLEINEHTAALYYIDQLINTAENKKRLDLVEFYQILKDLVFVISQKEQLPGGAITARFKNLVDEKRKALLLVAKERNNQLIVNAYLDYELNNKQKAFESLSEIDLSVSKIPFLHYIKHSLTEKILLESNTRKLLDYYPKVFNDQLLSHESRIYYAYQFLKVLNDELDNNQEKLVILNKYSSSSVKTSISPLFDAEILSMQLALSSDPKIQGENYRTLSKLMKANKADMHLAKAMHIRSISILGQAEQFKFMEQLSRHWLVVTNISNIEFYNVAEQYSVITLDKAYGQIAQDQLIYAYSTFYSAIRQTNDLEAHYQFLTLAAIPSLGKQKNVEDAYAVLKKQKLLGQHTKYVEALKLIMAFDKSGKKEADLLDKALVALSTMPNVGPSTAMRDLLSGYIYHIKLRMTKQGFDFNKSLYEKAHYHYMMALDFGRDNTRISATALQNLGWLHFEVRNYGISAEFFSKRIQIPFINIDDEIATRWAYNRSLFYNYQYLKVFNQAEYLLDIVKTTNVNYLPYLEKTAFYAVQAKEFEKAIKLYNQLLVQSKDISQVNLSKISLSLAYSYMKAGKTEESKKYFQQSLDLNQSLKPLAADENRMISFQPKRLELIALGLLANIEDDSKVKVEYLNKRIELLGQIIKNPKELTLDEAKVLTQITKHYNQLMQVHEKTGDINNLIKTANQGLESALSWAKQTGDAAGSIVYKTLINYMSLSISNPSITALKNNKNVKLYYESMKEILQKIPYKSDYDIYQLAKLEIFYHAYLQNKSELNKVLTDKNVISLQKSNFPVYEELKTYTSQLSALH